MISFANSPLSANASGPVRMINGTDTSNENEGAADYLQQLLKLFHEGTQVAQGGPEEEVATYKERISLELEKLEANRSNLSPEVASMIPVLEETLQHLGGNDKETEEGISQAQKKADKEAADAAFIEGELAKIRKHGALGYLQELNQDKIEKLIDEKKKELEEKYGLNDDTLTPESKASKTAEMQEELDAYKKALLKELEQKRKIDEIKTEVAELEEEFGIRLNPNWSQVSKSMLSDEFLAK